MAGFGALVSPLIATQFAQQKHWSFHYLISAALYVFNTTLLWFVFRGKRQDGTYKCTFPFHTVLTISCTITEVKAEAGDLYVDPNAIDTNKYKQIFTIRAVHFLSVFALIYVGTEVTIGGESLRLAPRCRQC